MQMRRWAPSDLGSKLKVWLDERGLVVGTGYQDDNDQSGNGVNYHQGTAADQPATGRTINGKAAPDFDGTNDWMDTIAAGKTLVNIVSAGAHDYWATFDADAISGTSTNPYSDTNILGDSLAYFGLFMGVISGVNKLFAYCWDTADRSVIFAPAALGLHNVHSWHESGQNNAELDGVAGTPVACGNLGATTGTPRIGNGYSAGLYFNGALGLFFATNAACSADERALAKHYVACRSGRAA